MGKFGKELIDFLVCLSSRRNNDMGSMMTMRDSQGPIEEVNDDETRIRIVDDYEEDIRADDSLPGSLGGSRPSI